MRAPENIILSRTDSIGDIVLAMPVAGLIKEHFPDMQIAILGRAYTRDIALACKFVDSFIDYEDFITKDILINGEKPQAIIHLITQSEIARRAKALKIPLRIGTSSRLYHWFTCNKLVSLSRKNSGLHEAQLNLKLLQPLKIYRRLTQSELLPYFGLSRLQPLLPAFQNLLDPQRYNLIIHPKSRGNAREWPIEHFIALINLLDDTKFKIFISGVESEIPFIREIIAKLKKDATVIAGTIDLAQFISFINAADGVVANSTGPVHVAAAMGKDVIGIYPPLKPKDPGRWGPIGSHAHTMVFNKDCNDCKLSPHNCACINAIQPLEICLKLNELMSNKFSRQQDQ